MSNIKHPFDDLKRIVKNNPDGSREDHERAAFKLFGLTGPYARPLFTYWFDNHIRQLKVERSRTGSVSVVPVKKGTTTNIPKVSPESRAAAKARTEAKAVDFGKRMQALSLLSLTTPYGKELRDCTVAQVRKTGAWYAALGKGRKASEVIGNFVSEKEARAVFDRQLKAAAR